MTLQNEGIGYKDLDELFAKPCDLEFILGKSLVECNMLVACALYSLLTLLSLIDSTELISVELPNEYEKETWQLNDNERSNTIKECREVGNELYRNGKIEEAEEKYRAALSIIEQLLIK